MLLFNNYANPRIQIIQPLLQQRDVELRRRVRAQVIVPGARPVNELNLAYGICTG
jgi:hypothetical protein